MKEVSRWIKD